jgi:hypothetical protein
MKTGDASVNIIESKLDSWSALWIANNKQSSEINLAHWKARLISLVESTWTQAKKSNKSRRGFVLVIPGTSTRMGTE